MSEFLAVLCLFDAAQAVLELSKASVQGKPYHICPYSLISLIIPIGNLDHEAAFLSNTTLILCLVIYCTCEKNKLSRSNYHAPSRLAIKKPGLFVWKLQNEA